MITSRVTTLSSPYKAVYTLINPYIEPSTSSSSDDSDSSSPESEIDDDDGGDDTLIFQAQDNAQKAIEVDFKYVLLLVLS
jgi:hypothetical protein